MGGAIDTVGGTTLATILKACREGAAVAATGMVDDTDLPTTVFPFIIRGVSLLWNILTGDQQGFATRTLDKTGRTMEAQKTGIFSFRLLT